MRKIESSGKTRRATRLSATRAFEIAAERLLDDDARVVGEASRAEPVDHRLEQRRRDRQIERRPLRRRRAPA